MLEADAKKKVCMVMSRVTLTRFDEKKRLFVYCIGSDCMGWDEHLKHMNDEKRVGGKWEPHDPPQGDCGMKPPESAG